MRYKWVIINMLVAVSCLAAPGKMAKTNADIEKIQAQLKKITDNEKKHREWAIELQETLVALKQQQEDTVVALRSQAMQLSRTLSAFRCMSANSPATLLATVHSQDDFIHTAVLLRRLMPHLQKVGESLRQELVELANVRTQINETETSLQKAIHQLQKQHKELTKALGNLRERQSLDAAFAEAIDMAGDDIMTANMMAKTKNQVNDISLAFTRPVQGVISKPFSLQEDYDGRGVIFTGTAEEAVRAPAPGRVLLVLPTKHGYRMVLQHNRGYQTVLDGLAHVDVKSGQSVAAQAVVGQLGAPLLGQPSLYCEIRRFSHILNPAQAFKGSK